jgi:GTP cyclohydrolase I
MVRIATRFSGLLWIEDLIEIGQQSGSSPVHALLKREDEKFVTDAAFDKAAFVEDVVRNAAQSLDNHPQVQGYRVEVESMESIHNHSAYACIETM